MELSRYMAVSTWLWEQSTQFYETHKNMGQWNQSAPGVVLGPIDQPFYFMKCAVVLLMNTPNQDPLFSDHEKIANTSQYFFSSDSEGRLLSKQLRISHMP